MSMFSVLDSLIPVLAVIAAGWAVHRIGIVDDAGRAGVEKLAYFVLFPCLIVLTLSQAEYGALPWQDLGAALFIAVVAMSGLCMLLRGPLQRLLGVDGPAFTSVFQGATRWNSFVALAIAGSLFGPEGLALIAVAIVAMVPLLNLLAVLVLSRYAGSTRPPAMLLLKEIARNPLIVSCVLGLALSLLDFAPTGMVETTLDIFGRSALGVGLVAVGMGLDASVLRRPAPVHLVAIGLRLFVMPAMGAGLAVLFGLSGVAFGTAIVALTVPTASNAYVLARQMGGDARLMAEIITLQTIAAVVTMPAWLTLLSIG